MQTRTRGLIRPILLGVVACAMSFGALEAVRTCDVTPPCPRGSIDPVSGLPIACSGVGIIGRCPVVSLNGLGGAVVGGAVGVWAYLRRRPSEPA